MVDQRHASLTKVCTTTQDMAVTARTAQATRMERTVNAVKTVTTVRPMTMTALLASVIHLVYRFKRICTTVCLKLF